MLRHSEEGVDATYGANFFILFFISTTCGRLQNGTLSSVDAHVFKEILVGNT